MDIPELNPWMLLISFLPSCVLYFSVGAKILHLITTVEPNVYIDEIFHVGQCVKYCDGNFTDYDPKLTTPPGLYMITVAVLAPLSRLSGHNLCTIHGLRCFNFVIAQCTTYLLYKILHTRAPSHSEYYKLRIAINLSLLPVLYFYSFFYYTDVVSTFSVLLTYYLYRTDRCHAAGFVGFLSVLIRQTNIIWFGIFAAIKCCECVVRGQVSESEKQSASYILIILTQCFHLLRVSTSQFIGTIWRNTCFFIFTVACFVYFITTNGSIVLGDKSSHEPVIHLPQLFYFSLFTAVFSFPTCLLPFFKLVRNASRFKYFIILSAIVCVLVVETNTMVHQFLLADNRHYTFYLWRRILSKNWGRFGAIPSYIVAIYCMIENSKHVDFVTRIAFIVGLSICVIPQKLLEFRYFIIPYLFYRLETCHKLTRWQIELEFAFNVLINYLTIAKFVQHTFLWPDGSVHRFSW